MAEDRWKQLGHEAHAAWLSDRDYDYPDLYEHFEALALRVAREAQQERDTAWMESFCESHYVEEPPSGCLGCLNEKRGAREAYREGARAQREQAGRVVIPLVAVWSDGTEPPSWGTAWGAGARWYASQVSALPLPEPAEEKPNG